MAGNKKNSHIYAYALIIFGVFAGYQAIIGLLDGAVLGLGTKSVVGGMVYRIESPIYYWVMETIDFTLSVLLIIAGLKEFRKEE
jgi:hypothetical protein